LIQNAKDSIVQDQNRQAVDIKIIAREDSLIFKHNGSPFTAEALLGLLYKYSGKKGNDSESTGRFGTGFLTTHSLSKIVSIEGDLYYDVNKTILKGFSATMYRNGINAQELLDGAEKMKKSLDYTDELNTWTTYTYHLETDENKKALKLGIENFIANITQVMLFCNELATVELDNNGFVTKIIRNQVQQLGNDIYISEFEISGSESQKRKYVHKKLSRYSDELSKRFKKERNLRLMIAIEIDKENNLVDNTNSPSHFCVLPLVGSEKHIMPFYLNSPDFEPDSERESLLLDGSDDWEEHSELGTIITVRGINRLILKESIELYESLVSFLSENDYHKLFLLAKGLKRTPDFEKNFNREWIEKEIILPYREVLTRYSIVETKNGNQKIFNDDKSPKIIIPQGNKEVRQQIYSLLTEIFESRLPLEKYADNWASLAWSGCGLFGIDNFCKYVTDKQNVSNLPNYEWMNKFLTFIKNTDETLLKKYALVPNTNGDFISLEKHDFSEGVGLTEFMLNILSSLGLDLKPKLLNNNITAISLPIKIDSKTIAEKIDEQVEKIIKDKNNSDVQIIFKLRPIINIVSDANNYEIDFLEKQLKIHQFSNQLFSNHEIKEVNNNDIPSRAWQSFHKWFIITAIKEIAGYKKLNSIPSRIENRVEWLNDFIAFVAKEEKTAQLDLYAIIPNQNGDFCLKKNLYRDADIPNQLKSEIAEGFGIILRNSLLDKTINSIEITQEKNIKTVISRINEIFSSQNSYKFPNPQNNMLDFAIYLLHFLPEESNPTLYKSQFSLLEIVRKYYFDKSKAYVEPTSITCTSEDFWNKANSYIILWLQQHIESNRNIDGLKAFLSKSGKSYDNSETLFFLNSLYNYLKTTNNQISRKIIPNQKGDFCSKNDLFRDADIPDELKSDKAEGFGIILRNSLLHKEINSVEITQSKDIKNVIATINGIFTNNPHFKFPVPQNDKLGFAIYLLHFLPLQSSPALYKSQLSLLDIVRTYYHDRSKAFLEPISISCTSEDFWNKANNFVISVLQQHIEEDKSIEGLKKFLSKPDNIYDIGDTIIFLNDFYDYLKTLKIQISRKIIPNQKGDFCLLDNKLFKDSDIPEDLKDVLFLINPAKDFRQILAEKSLSIQPMYPKTIKDIATDIDEIIKIRFSDSRNWEDEHFKKAIAILSEYFRKHKESKDYFVYSWNKKDSIELNVLWSEKEREAFKEFKEIGNEKLQLLLSKDAEINKLRIEKEALIDENKKLKEDKQTLEQEIEQLKKQIENAATDTEKRNLHEILTSKLTILEEKSNEIAFIGTCLGTGLSKQQQKEINEEARKIVKQELENRLVDEQKRQESFGKIFTYSLKGFEGYSNSPIMQINEINYPIVVKSYKKKSEPFNINPGEWELVTKEKNALFLVWDGNKINHIDILGLLKNQSHIDISFSTENLDLEERLTKFSQSMRYFKNIQFKFSSLVSSPIGQATSLSNYFFDASHENDVNDANSDIML